MNKVNVFLEGKTIRHVDEMVGILGNTRSEVIRTLLFFWFHENVENLHNIMGEKPRR